MAPPKFGDLGKASKDIFDKGYNYGFFKVDLKTKTGTGIQFNNSACQNTASGRLFGNVEVKYDLPDHGVTLTEKWNTDNVLGTEIVFKDRGAKGVKLTVENATNLNVNKHSSKVKAEYTHDRVMSDAVFDVSSKLLTAATVVQHEGWLVGAQLTSDVNQKKLLKHVFGGGYSVGNYALHSYVTDATDFGGSLYHKVNDNTEISANLGWNKTDKTTRFGLAGLYKLDRDTVLRTKVSSSSQLGVALQHQLKPGLKLILSSLVNMQNFNEGGHKIGFGLEYEN